MKHTKTISLNSKDVDWGFNFVPTKTNSFDLDVTIDPIFSRIETLVHKNDLIYYSDYLKDEVMKFEQQSPINEIKSNFSWQHSNKNDHTSVLEVKTNNNTARNTTPNNKVKKVDTQPVSKDGESLNYLNKNSISNSINLDKKGSETDSVFNINNSQLKPAYQGSSGSKKEVSFNIKPHNSETKDNTLYSQSAKDLSISSNKSIQSIGLGIKDEKPFDFKLQLGNLSNTTISTSSITKLSKNKDDNNINTSTNINTNINTNISSNNNTGTDNKNSLYSKIYHLGGIENNDSLLSIGGYSRIVNLRSESSNEASVLNKESKNDQQNNLSSTMRFNKGESNIYKGQTSIIKNNTSLSESQNIFHISITSNVDNNFGQIKLKETNNTSKEISNITSDIDNNFGQIRLKK